MGVDGCVAAYSIRGAKWGERVELPLLRREPIVVQDALGVPGVGVPAPEGPRVRGVAWHARLRLRVPGTPKAVLALLRRAPLKRGYQRHGVTLLGPR